MHLFTELFHGDLSSIVGINTVWFQKLVELYCVENIWTISSVMALWCLSCVDLFDQWEWSGNWTFVEVTSMVVTWWIVAFFAQCKHILSLPLQHSSHMSVNVFVGVCLSVSFAVLFVWYCSYLETIEYCYVFFRIDVLLLNFRPQTNYSFRYVGLHMIGKIENTLIPNFSGIYRQFRGKLIYLYT